MKSWFTKFRISTALDDGHKLPEPSRRQPTGSDELDGFEQDMAVVDRALRETAPRIQAPASLHRSIMRAVETARHRAERPHSLAMLRWLVAPAAAAVALMLVWPSEHISKTLPKPEAQSLAAAVSALEIGNQVARVAPSAVVAPLSDELERLNRDLDSAAQFLLASVP
jgi:hypothetical protein